MRDFVGRDELLYQISMQEKDAKRRTSIEGVPRSGGLPCLILTFNPMLSNEIT